MSENLKAFYHLVANSFAVSITNFTVWFAITFYVYLQTQSVFATAMLSGLYLVMTAGLGIWFGSLVDHHRKKNIMTLSSIISLVMYVLAFGIYVTVGEGAFKAVDSFPLWAFIVLIMFGVIASNLRMIALPTLVTLLVPENARDKANGLVGMTSGLGFLITSVISGVLVAWTGMFAPLLIAIVVNLLAIIDLKLVNVPEKKIIHTADKPPKIDIKGTVAAIRVVPGLIALIFFTTFNNFLGGVFMPLMDAYGLSLMDVQAWGFLWGVLSLGFIVGGMIISKFGLGKKPLRSLFIANIIIWTISSVFTIHESILFLAVGMFIYLSVAPFIEAAEQTIIQKVVPYERQGRVFGFAQSVEQAASPLTAFVIGPLTQFIFIPFMTDGAGVGLIGSWFGTGQSRGIALVFTVAGIIGLIVTLLAFGSKRYKLLSEAYANHKGHPAPIQK